ncbi:hypothetical protein NIES4103_25470 [Nostoc sp. NIES-4103]|nr:hypothetical protein NIES4103_25470 [Nostoc sp. NIES-4103]
MIKPRHEKTFHPVTSPQSLVPSYIMSFGYYLRYVRSDRNEVKQSQNLRDRFPTVHSSQPETLKSAVELPSKQDSNMRESFESC